MTVKATAVQAAGANLVYRRRSWQIDAGKQCSVLGTCLSLNDLHVLARRARFQVPPGTSAYHLHSWFVDMVVYPNELSKLVDKELENVREPRSGLRRTLIPGNGGLELTMVAS